MELKDFIASGLSEHWSALLTFGTTRVALAKSGVDTVGDVMNLLKRGTLPKTRKEPASVREEVEEAIVQFYGLKIFLMIR